MTESYPTFAQLRDNGAFHKTFMNAKRLLPLIAEWTDPRRTGFVSVFYKPRSGDSPEDFVSATIGILTPEEEQRHIRLAIEKPTRGSALLLPNWQNANSYASRDPENDKWGGAFALFPIEGSPWFGGSGLPEITDIVVHVFLAWATGLINEPRVSVILKAHNSISGKLTAGIFSFKQDARHGLFETI